MTLLSSLGVEASDNADKLWRDRVAVLSPVSNTRILLHKKLLQYTYFIIS